jgi:hypothetical protein
MSYTVLEHLLNEASDGSFVIVIDPVTNTGTNNPHKTATPLTAVQLLSILKELVQGLCTKCDHVTVATENSYLNDLLCGDLTIQKENKRQLLTASTTTLKYDNAHLGDKCVVETLALNNLAHYNMLTSIPWLARYRGKQILQHATSRLVIATPLENYDTLYTAVQGLTNTVLILYQQPLVDLDYDISFTDEMPHWSECCAHPQHLPKGKSNVSSPRTPDFSGVWFYYETDTDGYQIGWFSERSIAPTSDVTYTLSCMDRSVIADSDESQMGFIRRMMKHTSAV